MSNKSLMDKAYEIYQVSGQDGVLEWAVKNLPDIPWLYCEPCDYVSPVSNNECLVCWSPIESESK